MNNIKTIIKFELIRYFLSPLAYVYLVSFLLLSGSCAIYFGHFFIDGKANLWGLFDYQPWIYLLFLPGIAMRSWAEEFRSKNIIQLLTLPVSVSTLVWGKFFASWIFAIIAITLTFPFWITVNLFGTPDNAVILVSYFGCFVLAGAILSISQTMSSLTKSSVIALVLAVFVNLLFFWSGFEYVLFWARRLFSDTLVDTIISFSFLTRFSSFSRGFVEFRDLVFFGSLIFLFNILTTVIISIKTKGYSILSKSSSFGYNITAVLLVFIGFFALNIVANNTLRQINYDFTEDKYLTLTKNTKDILKKLPRPITAKLYYTPILEQRNPEIRQVFDQIKQLLKQYKQYSNGNFDYKIYNPKYLDKIEDRAIADGIQPIPLIDINQNALFGLTFADDLTAKSVIPFFSVERLPFLEQDLTTAIYKMQHKKKKLGLYTSLPIAGGVRYDDVGINRWEIVNKIAELYDITVINKPEDLDKDYDVLMLVHPIFTDNELAEKVKKHKKVLLLLDVADEASRLYSPQGGNFISSYLSDLADYWGIEFYNAGVVADFDNSITVDDTLDYRKNPSFTQDLLQFRVTENELNQNHRITYNLKNILFSSASAFMPKQGSNVLFFPLIRSSRNSALMDAILAKKSKAPREILEQFSPQNNTLVVAAEFLSNSADNPFDIIAVADTDFIYDAFWTREQKFLDKSYYIPLYDSANFILNALDYLTKNDDLIGVRGKTIKNRPLAKIDNMRKTNLYRYKLKENDIFEAINGAKQGMQEVLVKRNFEERESFTADELAVIGNIRKEVDNLRQQLSDLRTSANMNIAQITAKVKFYNIYFIALLIVFCCIFFQIKKNKHIFASTFKLFHWDNNLNRLSLSVMTVIILAGISIYFDSKSTISKYEDVPVFKDFDSKINDITVVKMQNSQHTLTFKKDKNTWILEEYPYFPVYQERIRSLFFSIANMTFYEKKSNKAEDMKYFGFSPLQNKQSPMTAITLYDKDNSVAAQFDVGWYDIDIGRGARAAYIKLNNQFQVWLADVDFYDLALNKDRWTYSSLWNLRFGRFISYNNIKSDAEVMNMVKILLNSTFEAVIPEKIKAEKIFSILVRAENDNSIDIQFYESADGKHYAKYVFLQNPKGKHLEFFAKYVKGKYLEISDETWEKVKNAATGGK